MQRSGKAYTPTWQIVINSLIACISDKVVSRNRRLFARPSGTGRSIPRCVVSEVLLLRHARSVVADISRNYRRRVVYRVAKADAEIRRGGSLETSDCELTPHV